MDQEIKGNAPQAVEVEKSILGLVIVNNNLINILLERMRSDYFYDPRNKIIFDAIRDLNFLNKPVDYTTIANELEKSKGLESIGGTSYIYNLLEPSYYAANIEVYMEIVKEKAILRNLLGLGHEVVSDVFNGQDDSESIIGKFSEKLFRMSEYSTEEGLTKLEQIVPSTYQYMIEMKDNDGELTGITTGFKDLDRQLSGLQNSDLILLAARPSVGKTALGINMGINAAKAGKRVAVFSLEMSKRQISQRIISMLTMVELQNIISGNITEEDWQVLFTKVEEIKDLDVYIDDTASISLTELRAKAKRKKQEVGLDLIVIDYLQLMTTDSKRVENRQQEISNISRGLKALAKELNIPVLALSQLSRKSEERTNKRPMLSDLRESGAIEQDADVVMMLYRDDYYNEDTEHPDVLEVIVGKHRNGPTGTVYLHFNKPYTSFMDTEYVPEDNS
ncbi:MAG: replicative DNA helicase [Tissierellia bacterium]|nr:replicative DNA helicase [Tissierellia bacterium]